MGAVVAGNGLRQSTTAHTGPLQRAWSLLQPTLGLLQRTAQWVCYNALGDTSGLAARARRPLVGSRGGLSSTLWPMMQPEAFDIEVYRNAFSEGTTIPPGSVSLFDNTLRDGEQTPGVAFSSADKVRIGRLLAQAGIPALEAGFAAVSVGERDAIREVQVCVNGMGERAGNTPLEQVVIAALFQMDYDFGVKLAVLAELSQAVAQPQTS